MNSILSASGDPRRHEARLKLSSKDSALPILVVEGKQDYRILHQRWNSGPETLRASIKIQYPTGEQSKIGVLSELRKNSENAKYHGLVDMDHDFEKRELMGQHRIYDTSPLVTFPTYAFRDKDAAVRVVKNIGGFGDFLNKAEKIVRLAKILTIIKLFKGKNNIKETSLEFKWEDVSIDIADDRKLLHQVSSLEIGSRHYDELDYFYSRYRDEISGCGYNDHMLFKAWKICFLDSYPSERKSMKFYRDKFDDEIRNRLTKKNNKFIDDLKQRILNG